MSRGREEECRLTVSKLRALPIDDGTVVAECLEITASVIFDERTLMELHPGKNGLSLMLAKFGILFTSRSLFRRLCMGSIIMFFQQFTGINAII